MANGSSGGLQALVMAVAGPGDEVIVPRNAHKALLAGLIFSGAVPVYVEPTIDPVWQVAVNVPLERFVAALADHPRARAVFVTSRATTASAPTCRRSPPRRTPPACRSSSTRPGGLTCASRRRCRPTPWRRAPTPP